MGQARRTGGTGPYVEGERVFAPPQGSFDVDWVASLAAERLDSSVQRDTVLVGVRTAWAALAHGWHVREATDALCAVGFSEDDAGTVVRAAVDFIEAYAVVLPGT